MQGTTYISHSTFGWSVGETVRCSISKIDRCSIPNIDPRRDSVPYAALYIAPILIDTRLHSTRGQFFIRHECGACIRLRTNTSLIRMISRSAYGFSIFVITCLHTSDERVQTLYTSCIRIHFLFCILEG